MSGIEPPDPDSDASDSADPDSDASDTDAGVDPTDHDTGAGRRRWPWALAVVAAILVWLVVAGLRLSGAAADAGAGVDAMRAARDEASGDLASFVDSVGDPGSPRAKRFDRHLADATASFESARDAVESPLIAPLRVLPGLGRQVRSVSALSGSAATTTAATRRSFHQLTEIAASAPSTPDERLAAARRTQDVLTAYTASIRHLDLGPHEGLVPPLADAYNRFVAEDARLHDTLGRALTAVTGLNRFLAGPTRSLVLAANNAEMRSGSGMFLQAGELTVDGGRFTLSEMRPTAKMVLPTPGTTMDPNVAALWGWTYPDRELRAVNVTPRFDESARMAADMWAAAGHQPVDGVIAVDVVGLKRLLKLVGPVQVSGPDGATSTVTADDVVRQLLVEQYRDAGVDAAERRDRLSDVAGAVFDAMNSRPFSPGGLLRALQGAGRGRHLLVWSKDPVQQAGWEALGASGVPTGDSMLLSIVNRGGNKLDQFLAVEGRIESRRDGAVRHVTVTVDVANRTPPGLPRYVAGPYPGLGTVAGQYVGVATLTIPGSASNGATSGADLFLSGVDGANRVLGTRVDLRNGASSSITYTFDLPADQPTMVVQPSARVPGVTWTAGSDTWTDDGPHTVVFAR